MDVRKEFLDFFHSKGHKIYDSMPLVPDDASLLFTNAGMVQFKDIFTGKVPIPTPNIATSSQLCIRAGGKHNDLENVGYTARHHTLFEMLGNFSFGAYFKKEAIAYAWEFVTKVLGFSPSLLYVTVHESDDEAFLLWSEHISPDRIKRMGDKDNFWQMGDTGPCGPCSEIYVDQGEKYFHTSEDYFGGEGDRFLEIWNLVFMQYERDTKGTLTPLPKPSIDTGMGLERVVALLEGKLNNFDTSLFAPLMKKIEELTGQKYYSDLEMRNDEKLQVYKETQASFRVIADHARSVGFLLAQGVYFDKEGRGYVLRRILRRAVRHGYLLGLKKPFLYEVISALAKSSMGEHYSYLRERNSIVMEQCRNEEERFFETIQAGMEFFNEELENLLKSNLKIFSGEVAFRLYDTYGFPLDLTQDMLRDREIIIDQEVFDRCMLEQKNRSKASWKGSGDEIKNGDFKKILDTFGKNEFVGYGSHTSHSKILALLNEEFRQVSTLEGRGYIFLDKTPFYPQSGGPIGDSGLLTNTKGEVLADVLDTKKYFDLNISSIVCRQPLRVSSDIVSCVDLPKRLEIAKHHSATHLLHYALRKILGNHISQAGSLVEPNRLRFDFSHPKALSKEELEAIEWEVNTQISSNYSQICETMPIDLAKQKGAMALFSEKYGDEVRVISFGDSIELCGGIHVENTANIGSFYIVKESGVSSGVRRIEAVCSLAAYKYGKESLNLLAAANEELKTKDILAGISKLKATIKTLKENVGSQVATQKLEEEMVGSVKLIVAYVESEKLKELVDNAKNNESHVAILLINPQCKIVAGVKGANIKANEWVKQVANILGGGGGGRDDFATAGGKDLSKLQKALSVAREFAYSALK